MKYGIPIIISAPSGAGKTSLVAAVVKQLLNLKISISHTTRPIRPGEINGESYYFISEEEFKAKIAANDFLEYAKVLNYCHYYGTSKSWLQEHLNKGDDVILEIDWQGAEQVRKIFKDAVSIFIFPPSLAILEQRLRLRGQDDLDIITKRMQTAKHEMEHYAEFDYLIINDDFQTALSELKAIILSARLTQKRMMETFQEILNHKNTNG